MSIVYSKLHDFSKRKTYSSIEKDIKKKYKIINIYNDDEEECLYEICDTLFMDYKHKLANYEAYIEKGMNARLLMELRNTALQRLTEEEFKQFDNCKSPMEVVNIRSKVMRRFTDPTDDVTEPWQLYLITIKSTNVLKAYKNEDIRFNINFEWCYEDGDVNNTITVEDLEKDFALNLRTKEGAIHKSFNHPY
jgi:hypothetical protein